MTRQCRYVAMLSGWLALYVLPTIAGDWYDSHFHVFQSVTSLAVIGLALKLYPHARWAADLCVVALLQIIHAIADYFQPGEPAVYNLIQLGFNGLEVAFLAIGGISEWLNGRFGTSGNSRPRSDSDSRNQGKSHA